MRKVVLFDLDGTLLPMEQEHFVKTYFQKLATKLSLHGYEPKKLVDAIWAGTAAMVKNDGSRTNEKAFWECFCGIYGAEAWKDQPLFEEYYCNEFQQVREVCGYHPAARGTVEALKAKGYRIALATNPIFPAIATESRIRWAGLEPEDFEFYTTYENASYCKPNPAYYREILERLGCRAEECLMVGNDVEEDMIAKTVGMEVFLLTDCLINKKEKDLQEFPQGSFADLMRYLEE